METQGLGTKATRAETITTLLDRRYIRKTKGLRPEENALNLVAELRTACPEIISPKKTKSLEKRIADLRGSDEEISVMIEELSSLRGVMGKLVGSETLVWNPQESVDRSGITLGKCPNCKFGDLVARRSEKSGKRYVRCSAYIKGCRLSSPLPPRGKIRTSHNVCKACGWTIIEILRSRKREGLKVCANYFCPLRKN